MGLDIARFETKFYLLSLIFAIILVLIIKL